MRHRRGRRPPVRAPALARDEEPHLDCGVDLSLRERERLARLGGDELARLVTSTAEELGDRANRVSPLDGRARPPVGLRRPRRGDRVGRILRARPGEAAEQCPV